MGLSDVLTTRFGETLNESKELEDDDHLLTMAGRGSCRSFLDKRVSDDLLSILCGVALSSPTKSDLQQRDIIIVRNAETRATLVDLLPTVTWLDDHPVLLVFCGNNRRQRLVHRRQGYDFVNDHLDAFFNAAVDAAIALSAFVTAAEIAGLGCCPISAIRNEAQAVSDVLALPDHVFPVAGLAVGYPKMKQPTLSYRLPLSACVHQDHYDESEIDKMIDAYDERRTVDQPYPSQRDMKKFGATEPYTWSEDKARQYNAPERETFGTFVRTKGFKLT